MVGEGRRLRRLSPASSRATIISTVIIASSTSSPSAMMSAPSEMRCKRDPHRVQHHEGDGQHQRDRDRHHQAGPHAEAEEADRPARWRRPRAGLPSKPPTAFVHDPRLVGHEVNADADRQRWLRPRASSPSGLVAELQQVAARAHGDGRARSPAGRRSRNSGCGGSRIAARGWSATSHSRKKRSLTRRLIALQALLRHELSADTHGDLLGTGLDDARRRHGVLRLQRLDERLDVSRPSAASLRIEKSR